MMRNEKERKTLAHSIAPTENRNTLNPPESPFTKGGTDLSSLWKREVERDLSQGE
jgi:hypothetical protein